MRRLIASAALLAGAWIGLAVPAAALTSDEPVTGQCAELVVDQAGVLSDADRARVAAAAAAFRTETSFEPRLWVLTQHQDGVDLIDWIEEQEVACGWADPDGSFRSNLVVIALTTDEPGGLTGETFIWYGDAMPDAMSSRYTEIESDVINPLVSDGRFGDALVDGLAAIQDVIQPKPSRAPLVFGIGAAVVGAGVGGGAYVAHRRRKAAARAALAQRFEAAATRSDRAVELLDPVVESIETDLELVRTEYHPEEAKALVDPVVALLGSQAELTNVRSDLVIARDQVLKDASDDELAQIVARWEDLASRSEELIGPFEQQRDLLTAALRVSGGLPNRVAAVPEAVELVRSAEAAAQEQGFGTATDTAVLASVPSRLAEVDRLAGEHRYAAADEQLRGVESDLEGARTVLASMPERLADLTERAAQADQRRALLPAGLDDARAAEAALAQEQHPAIAARVAGSAEGALADATRADTALGEARAALGARDLGAAGTALVTVEDALGRAEASAAAPGALLVHVRELASSVPARLGALRTAVQAVRGRARGGSAESVALDALTARLDAISLGERPDWLRASAELDAVEQQLAEVKARVEAAAREEARRRAARASTTGAVVIGASRGGWFRSGGSRSSFGGGSSGGSRSSGSSGGSRSGGGGSRSSGSRGGGGSRR